jgi:hypothetical protein
MGWNSNATSVDNEEPRETAGLSLSLPTYLGLTALEAHAVSAHWTCVASAGKIKQPPTDKKGTPMNHFECNYTVAPLTDSEPFDCRKPAIRRVALLSSGKDMYYCYQHWNSVKAIQIIIESKQEELTPEPC